MCTFVFTYTDKSEVVCEHVKSAVYTSGNGVRVTEQELATHQFPLAKDLWLFTENGSFCVSHNDLRSIEVTGE